MKTIDSIAGTKLTVREIDVIACIVICRRIKKTAKILDISPRTVETHIKNISGKLSCNGQEGINDFVERSGLLGTIKNHYLDLLMQYHLKASLEKGAFDLEKEGIRCYIHSSLKDSGLENISKYLKIAKVEIIDNHDNSNIQELKVLTEEDIELLEQGKQFANTIFICAREELKDSKDKFPKVKILDCTTVDHSCFSVFKILNLLAPAINLKSYEEEFTAAYKNLFPANGEIKEPVEIENIKEEDGPIVKRGIIKILAVIFGIIIIIFGTYFMKHKEKPQQISNAVEPVSYFVNHVKQVKLLEQNLAKYKKTSVVGVSGMGKTQLARMYAKENSGRYDIIWFFDCNLDINAEFLKLAKAINKAYGVGSVEENAPTAKRDVMEYLTLKSNWLLVFDNLKIGDNVKVKDLVEWEHNGHVIFGSQEATNLPHVVEMIAFAKQDAEQLARNILVEDNVAAVEFLATEFKGYPILIVQGAQLLNYVKGLSFEEYKKQIQESGDKIELNILLARQQLSSSAQDLLNKIALINNQAFSKDFLKIISNDPEKIGDDIYQLSKFALISNIDSDQNNPVFEMHDVVASKLSEINVDKNRVLLEGVIDNVLKSMPEGLFKAYVFRHTKTFNSNLIVISQNLLNYNVSVYKAMSLNLYVLSDYATNCDFNNCEKIVEWFNTKDQNNEFKLWLMSNAEKHCYGGFLANIGRYIKKRFANNTNALKYYEKAKEVFDQTLGHEDWKFNLAYILAKANIELGRISEAIDNTEIMRSILSSGVLEKGDICLMHRVKAFTDYYQGNYESALIEVDQDISESIKYGIKPKDPVFTSNYILKSQLLNALGRYEEAYAQTQQLMEMHKDKKADHEIFGRILTHMAAAELGMQKVEDASSHIEKAVSIFEKDQNRSQDPTKSQDPDLAAAYVVKADILFAQDNLLDAIKYYRKAQLIYHRLYKAREKNIAQVSYLYKQGAKAACKAQNLTFYQIFGKNQYRQFGEKHPNTVEILEYCESLGMNLWDKNAPQAN